MPKCQNMPNQYAKINWRSNHHKGNQQVLLVVAQDFLEGVGVDHDLVLTPPVAGGYVQHTHIPPCNRRGITTPSPTSTSPVAPSSKCVHIVAKSTAVYDNAGVRICNKARAQAIQQTIKQFRKQILHTCLPLIHFFLLSMENSPAHF